MLTEDHKFISLAHNCQVLHSIKKRHFILLHFTSQTSNLSWDEPNSNLGRPKLSQRSSVGSESNLRRVELIKRIRSVINFLSNEAQYTLSYKFLIY